jgi:hypothetical protein
MIHQYYFIAFIVKKFCKLSAFKHLIRRYLLVLIKFKYNSYTDSIDKIYIRLKTFSIF